MVEVFFKLGGIPSGGKRLANTLLESPIFKNVIGGETAGWLGHKLFNPNLNKAVTQRAKDSFMKRKILRTWGNFAYYPQNPGFINSPVARM